MKISDREAVACLKIVVAMAKADGRLDEREQKAIEEAIRDFRIPGVPDVENLLEEKTDISAEAKALRSEDARMLAYQSACGMAMADGECSPEEQQLLERLRKELGIPEKKASLVSRLFQEAKDTVLPGNIQPVSDPAKRAAEIREDVLKYSILSAILGAFPVPGLAIATDLAVVGVQVKMVRDIGQYYGHKVDKAAARSLLGALELGTGARIAVSNLCKLVPVWGSAVGAAASFAATWALGKIADRYFAGGAKEAPEALRDEFKKAEKEGRQAYEQHRKLVEEKREKNKAAITELNEALKAGRISQEEYERRVSELA
jgi:uncharacterized protein (DUF697 family)/tellurite resistance protein